METQNFTPDLGDMAPLGIEDMKGVVVHVGHGLLALWLGRESVETTQMYLHADMRLKEKALSRTESLGVKPTRYRPNDKLLGFLESL
jgi:hypothetical protein